MRLSLANSTVHERVIEGGKLDDEVDRLKDDVEVNFLHNSARTSF